MPFGATPSRWCVYQFHHLGEYSVVSRASRSSKERLSVRRSRVSAAKRCGQGLGTEAYFGAAAGAEGDTGTSLAGAGTLGAACVAGAGALAAARAATDVLIP
jgi:hypothetical protein